MINGRYQQAEFAADLDLVHRGIGSPEYTDPIEFFRRTFITEGLKDLQIMPSSMPIDDNDGRNELLRFLDNQWEPIIATDVDGAQSVPTQLDRETPNFGRVSACKRVGRSLYMVNAPGGIDEPTARIVLENSAALKVDQPGLYYAPLDATDTRISKLTDFSKICLATMEKAGLSLALLKPLLEDRELRAMHIQADALIGHQHLTNILFGSFSDGGVFDFRAGRPSTSVTFDHSICD